MAEVKKSLSLDQFKVDPKKASQADINAALELLAKKKFTDARIKTGELKGTSYKKFSELSPEEKAKRTAYSKRLVAKNTIMINKAKEKGITVTDAEIDAYLASK
jgi:hypothetical protein